MKNAEKKPQQQKANQMKLVGNYVIYQERMLGQGQYGKVYEAVEQMNASKRFAVKVIPCEIFQASMSNSQMLQKEIDVLKKLRHENLVCLHEISQSPNNLYLFLDYCNGGDLASYIDSKPNKRISESEAITLFKQFVLGYQHLYQSKIIHRDIKPENLMLHNGRVKLGDFGFGRFVEGNMNQTSRMSIKCTPIYASPQLLKKEQYSSKCDVWSSGCLLYKMIFGEYPFIAKDMMSLIKDIESKVRGVGRELKFPPIQPEVSADVKLLFRQMLKYEENDRISWDEVFVHPALTKKSSLLNGATDEPISESEKGNPIFQSIIENRNHIMDDDNVISDRAQNFRKQFKEQPKEPINPMPNRPNVSNVNEPERNPVDRMEVQKVVFGNLKADQSPTGISVPRQAEGMGEEQYRASIQKLQQADVEQFRAGLVDKLMLFLRNQALFADVTMQLVFAARNKYSLPQGIFYEMIFSLSGYYNFRLELLRRVCDQSISSSKILPENLSEEDFQVYRHSKHCKKTVVKIEKDSATASAFYKTLSTGILKEVQQQIVNGTDFVLVDSLKDFEKFLKLQSANFVDYKNRFNEVAKKALALLNPDNYAKDVNSLRGIRGIQIFFAIDKFMPLSQFMTFDFRLFYDQYMNKTDAELLLRDIKQQKALGY